MAEKTYQEEMKFLAVIAAVSLIITKIVFYKEEIETIVRYVFAFFWIFVLPGYALLLAYREKFESVERFFVSIPLSAAIIGIVSYYLGLLGLNVKYHQYLLPLLIIGVGLFFLGRKKRME